MSYWKFNKHTMKITNKSEKNKILHNTVNSITGCNEWLISPVQHRISILKYATGVYHISLPRMTKSLVFQSTICGQILIFGCLVSV